jgi:hypothetical protein
MVQNHHFRFLLISNACCLILRLLKKNSVAVKMTDLINEQLAAGQ